MEYWDLNEQQRAALTEEEVRAYCTFELMKVGVVIPKCPEPLIDTEVHLLTTESYEVQEPSKWGGHTSTGWAFDTLGQAQAFINLKPYQLEKDYSADAEFFKPKANLSVQQRLLPSEAAVNARRAELEQNKSRRDQYTKDKNAYDQAMNKSQQATKGIWDDYRERQERARHLTRIVETYTKYVELTKGDRSIARTFLGKAYTAEDINLAIGPAEEKKVLVCAVGEEPAD